MQDDNPTYMLPRPMMRKTSIKTGHFQTYYHSVKHHDTKRTMLGNLSGIATTDAATLKKIMGIKVRMNFITDKDFKKGRS